MSEENIMSDQTLKIIITAVLFLHGIAHVGAIGALMAQGRVQNTGGWLEARSWLFPKLATPIARTVAILFWAVSIIGFVAAALSFWGVLLPGEAWRQIAVASAVVSGVGIVLFLGNWPVFNTLAALGVNVAVLVTQLWLKWPPVGMFGK
jgi:hypothetical protein